MTDALIFTALVILAVPTALFGWWISYHLADRLWRRLNPGWPSPAEVERRLSRETRQRQTGATP